MWHPGGMSVRTRLVIPEGGKIVLFVLSCSLFGLMACSNTTEGTGAPSPASSGTGSPSSSSGQACSGTALRCGAFLPQSCTYQPNCAWVVDCVERNVFVGCAQSDKTLCTNTIGCTWQNPDGTKEGVVHAACEGEAAR